MWSMNFQLVSMLFTDNIMNEYYIRILVSELSYVLSALLLSIASLSFLPSAYARGGGTAFPICLCLGKMEPEKP